MSAAPDKPASTEGQKGVEWARLAWRRKLARMSSFTRFVYLFLCVGFFLGTVALLGPVRWIVTAIRASKGSENTESNVVFTVILVLLLIVFVVTRVLHYVASLRSPTRAPIYLGSTLLAALGIWVWMHPTLMAKAPEQPDVISAGGSLFDFGPYPVEADFKRLKKSGYTAIISLLHPAVVPFEPKLLADERVASSKLGLIMIELPMLPWISENAAALDSLRKLAARPGAKYYVHCYLGRDRVGVARRVLAEGGTTQTGMLRTSLDTVKRLERGQVEKLVDGVFLTPYPTDDEYFVFIVGGGVKSVVSLMDSAILSNREWIAREKVFAAKFGIDFSHIPVGEADSVRLKVVTERIVRARKPVVVHDFLGNSPAVEALKRRIRGASK